MKESGVVRDLTRAAVELFAAQGYGATSVQQIVDAAGVTKGAMYHYFKSKDDLLFGIYDRLLSAQKMRLDEIMAVGGDTEDVLRAVCIDVIETSIASLDEASVFFQSQHLLSDERRRDVGRRRRSYHEGFAALVERGQGEGLYRNDIPTTVLVANFFSDVHYLANWYSTNPIESSSRVAEHITDLFIDGLRNRA